jgi:hypothetical protein
MVQKNNAFLVKNSGAVFSKEAGNITNQHSFKSSGLVNKKVRCRPFGDALMLLYCVAVGTGVLTACLWCRRSPSMVPRRAA